MTEQMYDFSLVSNRLDNSHFRIISFRHAVGANRCDKS